MSWIMLGDKNQNRSRWINLSQVRELYLGGEVNGFDSWYATYANGDQYEYKASKEMRLAIMTVLEKLVAPEFWEE